MQGQRHATLQPGPNLSGFPSTNHLKSEPRQRSPGKKKQIVHPADYVMKRQNLFDSFQKIELGI